MRAGRVFKSSQPPYRIYNSHWLNPKVHAYNIVHFNYSSLQTNLFTNGHKFVSYLNKYVTRDLIKVICKQLPAFCYAIKRQNFENVMQISMNEMEKN